MDLHAHVINSTEISFTLCTDSFSENIDKTIIWYHIQWTDIHTNPWFCPDFPHFHLSSLCMCVFSSMTFRHVCRFVCPPALTSQGHLELQFYRHGRHLTGEKESLPQASPIFNPWKLLICLWFPEQYIQMESGSVEPLELAFSHSAWFSGDLFKLSIMCIDSSCLFIADEFP